MMKLIISVFVLVFSLSSLNAYSESAESVQVEINRLHAEKKDKDAVEYALSNMRVIEREYGVKSVEYADYLSTIGGLYAFAGMNTEANKYFLQSRTVRQQNKLPLQAPGIGTEGYMYMLKSKGAVPNIPKSDMQQSGTGLRSFSDLNRDGKCDQVDLDIFTKALNTGDREIADFDRSGDITENDKTIFMQFWNNCKKK